MLDYQSLGRAMFAVEKLPDGPLAFSGVPKGCAVVKCERDLERHCETCALEESKLGKGICPDCVFPMDERPSWVPKGCVVIVDERECIPVSDGARDCKAYEGIKDIGN